MSFSGPIAPRTLTLSGIDADEARVICNWRADVYKSQAGPRKSRFWRHLAALAAAFGGAVLTSSPSCAADGAVRVITATGTVYMRASSTPPVADVPSVAARTPPAAPPVAVRAKPSKPKAPKPFPEDDPNVRICVAKAVTVFPKVEPLALYLILEVEGGAVGLNSLPNKNGTYDIGPAQINSSHLVKLAARGISQREVRESLCTNILVQAFLYNDARKRAPTVAKAIALYHSPTPDVQLKYLANVEVALARRQRRQADMAADSSLSHAPAADVVAVP